MDQGDASKRPGERDRHQAILAAAQTVFGQWGYHQATVRMIAREADCATGTFYLYFSSKEACFLALVNRLYTTVMEAVMRERKTGGRPLEKLRAAQAAVARILVAERDLARVVLVASLGSDPRLSEHLRGVRDAFITFATDDLIECGLAPAQAALGARAWVGALAEVVDHWAHLADPDIALEEAVEEVSRIFMTGWGLQPKMGQKEPQAEP